VIDHENLSATEQAQNWKNNSIHF